MRAPKVTQGRPSRAAIASASAAPMPAATTDRDVEARSRQHLQSAVVKCAQLALAHIGGGRLPRCQMAHVRITPEARANRARLSAIDFPRPSVVAWNRRRQGDRR